MEKIEISEVISSELKVFWGEEPTSTDESTKVIKTNNLSYEGKISFDNITLRAIDKNKIGSNYLKCGDLLIEKSGGTKTHSVGYVNYFDGQDNMYVANNFILPLRPNKEKIIPKFLFYQMRYFYENGVFSNCYNKTTGIQNLKKDTYLSKKVIVPFKDIQAKIKDELENIETLINSKKESIIDLDKLIKSRFIEMFGDPMINDKNWESKPLGELCSIVRGGSPRPIEKFLGGNIPWIKIGDATDGDELYITKTAQYIIPEGLPKTRFIKAGSLIFANCGVSLGFCRILKIDGCIHDGWLAFQDISKSLNSIFLLSSINQTTQELRDSASGGTQPNLNTQIMSKYIQIVPPLYLQEKYVDFLLQIDKSKFI